jgi:hypothetical protein
LSGSKVEVVEHNGKEKRSIEESRADASAAWQAGGVSREVINIGTHPYRELSIQVK